MPLAVGNRLGSYEIVSTLGAGGMGEVYRARDTKLNRDVKSCRPDQSPFGPSRLARVAARGRGNRSSTHD
jgi:serine/threonine protein kinase